MSSNHHVFACVLTTAIAVALAACGHTAGAAANGQASVSGSSASGMHDPLKITRYGPNSTKAGVPFNVQPNGKAALWVRLNQTLNGDDTAIELDGILLHGTVSGNLVTATVPKSLYGTPGTFTLFVIARQGSRTVQSNGVKFTVE